VERSWGVLGEGGAGRDLIITVGTMVPEFIRPVTTYRAETCRYSPPVIIEENVVVFDCKY